MPGAHVFRGRHTRRRNPSPSVTCAARARLSSWALGQNANAASAH